MNQVIVSAKITRTSTQEIKIEYERQGTGDDIVDQWADRILFGMQRAVQVTLIEVKKKE